MAALLLGVMLGWGLNVPIVKAMAEVMDVVWVAVVRMGAAACTLSLVLLMRLAQRSAALASTARKRALVSSSTGACGSNSLSAAASGGSASSASPSSTMLSGRKGSSRPSSGLRFSATRASFRVSQPF